MPLPTGKKNKPKIFPVFNSAFWKLQFQTPATSAQKIFDWIFGVILPVLCCLFDPLVFNGALSRNGAVLGEYKPFAYLLSSTSIILMMLFLLFGQKLGWFNAFLAGLFLCGSAVCLLVGILILPFSLVGLIFLIGLLGFTPFLAGFVYFRSSIRAIGFAELTLKDPLLLKAIALGAIFSFVVPYVFYVNVDRTLREMEIGNAETVRRNTKKLRYVAPFINIDRLALRACGESNESRDEIRKAVYELSGMNDEKINRQYCYDW